jgi:ERCC4-type nuclease
LRNGYIAVFIFEKLDVKWAILTWLFGKSTTLTRRLAKFLRTFLKHQEYSSSKEKDPLTGRVVTR